MKVRINDYRRDGPLQNKWTMLYEYGGDLTGRCSIEVPSVHTVMLRQMYIEGHKADINDMLEKTWIINNASGIREVKLKGGIWHADHPYVHFAFSIPGYDLPFMKNHEVVMSSALLKCGGNKLLHKMGVHIENGCFEISDQGWTGDLMIKRRGRRGFTVDVIGPV